MADEDWLRSLIEKMDQDRRELDARVQHSIDKIERLIERQTDAMEKTRQEISAQNNVINSRIDQAYAHFQSTANDTKWAVVASVVAIVALVVTVILK